VNWNDIIENLNSCGYKIKLVSPEDWQKHYLPLVDEWNAIYPLVSLYMDGGVHWASMQNIPFQRSSYGATLFKDNTKLSSKELMNNIIRIFYTFFGHQSFV
jgi:hypothetical protein